MINLWEFNPFVYEKGTNPVVDASLEIFGGVTFKKYTPDGMFLQVTVHRPLWYRMWADAVLEATKPFRPQSESERKEEHST